MTTLLITCPPHSPNARHAFDHAKHLLDNGKKVQVFFYGDGAYVANGLAWQPDNLPNLANDWATLATTHHLPLPVCVSTALARGICDDDNAKRHHLPVSNLKSPFALVGLTEFALMLNDGELVQYA